MEDQHLTPELLDALVRYELPPIVLSGLIWNHLLAVCPGCAEGVEEWKASVAGKPSYDAAFAAAQKRVEAELTLRAYEEEGRKATREFHELMRTPPEKRLAKIKGATRRFGSVALTDMLLEQCKQAVQDDPRQAVHFASLACEVAVRIKGAGGAERQVLSTAWEGYCLSASGSPREAEKRLQFARKTFRSYELVDSLVHAELDFLEGIVLKDLRRLPEAQTMLSRARLIFRLARENVKATRALLALATVHRIQGKLDEALNALHEATRSIDPEEEPRLYLIARHNLASCYYERGEIEAAKRVLEESRPEYARCGDHAVELRRMWLEGRIARAEDRFEEAEQHFQRTARGFEKLEIGYDTALVALELAELFLAQGKTAAVKALSERLQPVLAYNDLHQEAIAALTLFQNAAAQELVTSAMLKRLRDRLEEMRAQPRASTGVEA